MLTQHVLRPSLTGSIDIQEAAAAAPHVLALQQHAGLAASAGEARAAAGQQQAAGSADQGVSSQGSGQAGPGAGNGLPPAYLLLVVDGTWEFAKEMFQVGSGRWALAGGLWQRSSTWHGDATCGKSAPGRPAPCCKTECFCGWVLGVMVRSGPQGYGLGTGTGASACRQQGTAAQAGRQVSALLQMVPPAVQQQHLQSLAACMHVWAWYVWPCWPWCMLPTT